MARRSQTKYQAKERERERVIEKTRKIRRKVVSTDLIKAEKDRGGD